MAGRKSIERLAIVTSHPIQYNAPWFRLLAQSGKVIIKVFYTWEQSSAGAKYDPGFGKVIEWDIPLLEGYEYEFVKNISAEPGSHHYKGIINPDLNQKIQEWKADAILVFGWSFHSHLRCLRFFHKKIPVLFRGDSTLLDERKGWRKLARRLFLRWVFSHVDYALYTGTNNKDYFLKHGLKENQLEFAPHAIDNERFYRKGGEFDEKAKQWRKDLSIEDSDLVVLFAGKFEKKKNPALLLQIAAELKNPDLKFVLVGNGELEASLKEEAKRDNRIHFLDFQNQHIMPVTYRLGDIFMLPSNGPGETWGLAVNEAMACGRVIMVSDKAGCAVDLVKQDKNGIIFPHNQTGESITFLKTLLADKEKLTGYGKRSVEMIAAYSYKHIVNSIIELLEKIR